MTTCSHTVISFVLFLFSIFSYYFILWVMNYYYGFYNFAHFPMLFESMDFYLSSFFMIVLCVILDRGVDKFCRIFGIVLDPLHINLKQFETKVHFKEMSIIRAEIKKEEMEINNDFKGSAFTYSNNNELKMASDKKKDKSNDSII